MSSDSADSPGRSAPARRTRRTLLVFCDSLSYYGPTGGLPADDPRIWPNIVAEQLGWDVELIGRIGWTCRDVWWAATQDPRSWAALPRAGAVIFATSGMDSLPSPLPTALRELIRYVRPPFLRRWARDGYGWLQPRLSRWHGQAVLRPAPARAQRIDSQSAVGSGDGSESIRTVAAQIAGPGWPPPTPHGIRRSARHPTPNELLAHKGGGVINNPPVR